MVVVMAERDKEEMELDIAKMEFDFKGTSVICRSGSPLILSDLKKVQSHAYQSYLLSGEYIHIVPQPFLSFRKLLCVTNAI